MNRENPAAKKLIGEALTCVLYKDGAFFTGEGIGVKPLMTFLRQDSRCFEGAYVADKVIGKAAAMLLLYGGGAEAVYGGVMSDTAVSLLESRGISCGWGERVPCIRNRTDTGICPLEEAVASIDDPAEAYAALQKRIAELMAGKK